MIEHKTSSLKKTPDPIEIQTMPETNPAPPDLGGVPFATHNQGMTMRGSISSPELPRDLNHNLA